MHPHSRPRHRPLQRLHRPQYPLPHRGPYHRFWLFAPSIPVAPVTKYLHNLWLWIGPFLGKLTQAWQGRRTARERFELTGISGADGEPGSEGAGGDGADVTGFNPRVQVLFLDPRKLSDFIGEDQATGQPVAVQANPHPHGGLEP